MRWLLACLIAFSLLSAAPTLAPAGDQDRARDAVQAGEARPLGAILRGVRGRYPGRLLDADLMRRRGVLIYRLRILRPDDRVTVLIVDAKSGQVLRER